jgi:hypothetical protein
MHTKKESEWERKNNKSHTTIEQRPLFLPSCKCSLAACMSNENVSVVERRRRQQWLFRGNFCVYCAYWREREREIEWKKYNMMRCLWEWKGAVISEMNEDERGSLLQSGFMRARELVLLFVTSYNERVLFRKGKKCKLLWPRLSFFLILKISLFRLNFSNRVNLLLSELIIEINFVSNKYSIPYFCEF